MQIMGAKQGTGAGCHSARHFAALPGIAQSQALLDEIAAARPILTPVSIDRPKGLYGAGNLGAMARDFLRAVWQDFDFVIDRNAETLKHDPAWAGKPVYHPDDVPEDFKHTHQLLVAVATAPYVPLETYLSGLGFLHIVPFYDYSENFRHLHPLSNGWHAGSLSDMDRSMTAEVLSGFGDDVSRAHHLQFLAWRRLRQEWTFAKAPVDGGDRFFIMEVVSAIGNAANFLDGGAHHGSVTLEFARRFPDWATIVAVEPDAINRGTLEKAFATHWPEGITSRLQVFGQALGATQSQSSFHSGLGYASQLSETGSDSVAVMPIDRLGLAPDFIKLHLEGAELDTLKGALQTIRRHRPVIAATVYHNDDGIWRTPLWMMQSLENYRLVFRLHSWCGTGAVIYAIPDERISR